MDEVIGRAEAERFVRAQLHMDKLAENRPRWLLDPHNNGQLQFLQSRHTIRIAIPGNGWGKGQRVSLAIPTPSGYRELGDIQVGDQVFGADGKPTEVLGVYPQPSRLFYRITFNDNTTTECCKDHLWTVQLRNNRFKREHRADEHGKWVTVDTQHLVDKVGPNPTPINKPAIPMCEPVEFPAKPVPMDPYVLGLLIGDGSTGSVPITFSKPDIELADAIAAHYRTARIRAFDPKKCPSWTVYECDKDLRKTGLFGNRSWEKFVPKDYLWNSPDVRLAILQGLMDTDGGGSTNKPGQTFDKNEFSTTSEQLADDVVFLVQSLGGNATKSAPRKTTYTCRGEKKFGRPSWRVCVWLPVCPYRLRRKADLWRKPETTNNRLMTKFEPIGEHEGVCIKVAAPDGLYLIEHFIVTHNTTSMGMDFDMALQKDDPYKGDMLPKWPMICVWVCQKFQQMDIMRQQLEEDVWTRPWTWNQTRHFYQWPNGGKLFIISGDSDWTHIQGIPVDLVGFDEHPDRKLWNEFMFRRRGRRKTRFMVAATMTQGMTWFVKEVVQDWESFHRNKNMVGEQARKAQLHPRIFVWDKGGLRDNPAMSKDDIDHYNSIAHAGDKELKVRLDGGYADFTGESVFDQKSLDVQVPNLQDGTSGTLRLCDLVEAQLIIPAGLDKSSLLKSRLGGRNVKHYVQFDREAQMEAGNITLWEMPSIECSYVIGADFAAGLVGRDCDCAIVCKKRPDGVLEQVAEAKGWWGDAEFAEILYSLGLAYFNAFVCGERQFGLPALRRLYDEWHYPYVYRGRLESTRSRRPSDLLGHHRSPGDTVIPNLRSALLKGHLILRSKELMEELRNYQYRPKHSTVDPDNATSDQLVTSAPAGMRDDMVMGLAYCWHAAREVVKFNMPIPDYAPGTFGSIFQNDKTLRGIRPKPERPLYM